MPRKRYAYDINTTTVPVSKVLHKKIKVSAKRERRTIKAFVDTHMSKAVKLKEAI
jgi:predicted HicB family RNase H-like nuclease